MSFGTVRQLAVDVGDQLVVLETSILSDFPLPSGTTFDAYISRLEGRLAELLSRTRPTWKRELLALVQKEVSAAVERARAGDEDGSHRLFVDAEMHFRQYERGEPPKVTFIAGPDGQLTKSE